MPEKYILDKALKTGVLYRAEDDKYLVIDAVGTDSTTKGTLTIDGSTVLEILDDLALPEKSNAKRFPPMDLLKNLLVIPPKKPFTFVGSSGGIMRVLGSLMVLAPGEGVPTAHLARFTEQPRKYYTYVTGSWTAGAGDWADGAEETVIDETCSPGERWTFDQYAYVERKGEIADMTFGNIGLRVFIDDKPLDVIDPALGPMAIDSNRGDYYNGTGHFYVPFSIAEMPIVLEAGRNLKVKVRNISGAAITLTAVEQIEMHVVKQRELL
jgi:hypothetical protein